MKRRSTVVTAVAIVFGTVLALLLPGSPAVGFYSPPLLLDVRIDQTAELVARGAAIEVRVEITCSGADYAYVDVSVIQRVGSDVASGTTNFRPTCGPQRQTVVLLVPAYSDKAFKQGAAVADASIYGCAAYGYVCGTETDSRTISIVH